MGYTSRTHLQGDREPIAAFGADGIEQKGIVLESQQRPCQQSSGHTTPGRSSMMQEAFLDEVRVNIAQSRTF